MCCQHCCNQLASQPISHADISHAETGARTQKVEAHQTGFQEVSSQTSTSKKHAAGLGPARLVMSLLSGVIGTFLLASLAATLPSLIGWSSIKVLGSSMGTKLPLGSIAVTRQVPADQIRVGDVILFSASHGGVQTLHRVKRFETVDAKRVAITQGDANQHEDLTPVEMNQSGSVVQYHVPLLGFVFAFLASKGTLLLVAFGVFLLPYVFVVAPSQKKKSVAVISQPKLTV